MIASERRIVSEGETRHSLTKKLALSGRPVKIYVIDPKQFQARLQKYVAPPSTAADSKSSIKKSQKSESSQKSQKHHGSNSNKSGDGKAISSDQYKITHPILIAPKESITPVTGGGGTTIIFPPATTLLPLPTMIPVSLSLPIMSVGIGAGGTLGLGAAMAVNNVISVPSSSGVHPHSVDKKAKKKKPVKKRKMTGELSKRNSISEEKAEAAEMAFLMKESTTRTGRVSKSNTMASAVAAAISSTLGTTGGSSLPGSPMSGSAGGGNGAPSPAPSTSSVASSQGGQRAKKREPPEKFRCQTCQRFYLGNAKFNQHFDKFPDHVKPDPNVRGVRKKARPSPAEQQSNLIKSLEMVTGSTMNENETENQSSCPFNSTSPRSGPFNNIAPSADEDSLGIGDFSPLIRRNASVVNPDTLSDNCTSPKLPGFSMRSTPDIFVQQNNNADDASSHNLQHSAPHLTPEIIQRDYFREFQTNFNASMSLSQIPSELIGNGSCSQQSFNSLENLLANSNSHMGSQLQSPSILEPLPCDVVCPRSCNGNTDVSTFFSTATTLENVSHHIHNSSINISSYTNSVNSCSIPVLSVSSSSFLRLGERVDEESRDACLSNNADDKDGFENCERNQIQNGNASPSNPKRRSIWEFVKEQIRLCGINQTCGEISKMADKLSKIARDKFYPIQEDEMERLGTSSPVIQVDTPFISHLLDLPIGTYIFKEDGGIRKIVPPPTPVSTELSLTNGVEVDVDKFLSPDIDLMSLPHLTNLDFNSICN